MCGARMPAEAAANDGAGALFPGSVWLPASRRVRL